MLAATYAITGSRLRPRSPHEMYLRRDGDRILLFVSAPPASPSLEVIDISDPYAPVRFACAPEASLLTFVPKAF